LTQLSWQRDGTASGAMTWDKAASYCANLKLGSPAAGGWRLPNAVELYNLLDRAQQPVTIDPAAFPLVAAVWYWTSTLVSGLASQHAAAYFGSGLTGVAPTVDPYRALCVRGGCVPGGCDDANACTTDTCDADGNCQHPPVVSPPAEVCNGADDDCNGQTDDGVSCDDSNACTSDSCGGKKGCQHGNLSGPCSDGLTCTDESCQNGVCTATAIECKANATCAEPAGCTCDPGFVTDWIDGQHRCAIDYPIWGARPLSPPAAWFVDNGDDTVTDTQTQLTWQKTPSDPMLHGAAMDYCSGLGTAALTDWRLPSDAELQSLSDFGAASKALPAVFPAATGDFWSATPVLPAATSDAAWFVSAVNAANSYNGGYTLASVRCVFGDPVALPGAKWPPQRFVATPDTILDTATNLTWQRDGTLSGSRAFQGASDYCAGLAVAGGGWRVPSITELSSLVDRSLGGPMIDNSAFPKTINNWYWSSTTDANNAANAWTVQFSLGNNYANPKSDPYGVVRCVKGQGACQIVDCDDGDACTTDTCTVSSGTCTHSDKCVDGQACTIDVCASGTCSYPPRYFDKTYGGAAFDLGVGGLILSDGYLLTGKSQSFGDGKTEDTYMIRTDRAGTQLWGSNLPATAAYAAVPAGSGFVLGGTTWAKGAGDADAWIAKLDAQGTVVWDKTFGTALADMGSQIIDTGDGYALAGYRTAVTFDAWLIRTDADGNKLWDKTYSGDGSDKGNAVVKLSGGYVLGGTWGGVSPDFVSDGWLIRTDLSGNLLWDVKYGGPGTDELWSVQPLADGFVLAGTTNSKGAGGTDIWVVRTDLQGQKMWDRTYGGTGNDAGGAIDVLADGGLALGGYQIVGSDNLAWLMRTDSLGNVLWQKTYGTFNSGVVSLKAVSDGIVALGWTMQPTTGNNEYWFLRTDSFGNASCAASGACVGKAVDGCDDANACTADQCTASGCQHANLDEWTPCGAGLVCSGTGVCQDVKASKGMAYVPAGTFWMGCNASNDANCQPDESPQHKVTLSSYYMDVNEVTTTQWQACMDGGGCTVPQGDSLSTYCNWDTAGGKVKSGREQFPVNCVTWTQSQAYCKWRGADFDLPTEAQWEMAARGDCVKNGKSAGDATCAQAMRTYPWGDATADCTYAVMSNGTSGCGTDATWAVGSKTAGDSPYGLHDMAGNVREWNRDWYAAYPSTDQTDPMGPGSGSARSARSGAFHNDAKNLRASRRLSDTLSYAGSILGLRCSRNYP